MLPIHSPYNPILIPVNGVSMEVRDSLGSLKLGRPAENAVERLFAFVLGGWCEDVGLESVRLGA